MRRSIKITLYWLILPGLLAAAPTQGDTPPGPDLLQACLEGKVRECLLWVFNSPWWLVIAAVFVLVGGTVIWAYLKGWGKSLEKRGEEDADRFLSADLSQQELAYLKQARKSYRYFKFRGLPRVKAEGIEPPRLDKAFVSLRMLPGDETGHVLVKGKHQDDKRTLEEPLTRHQEIEPVNLGDAIQRSHKLAVIGVAGSGKSTLLQWAGLACACARLEQFPELSGEQRAFLEALNGKLPVPFLIPLRAFNEYCKAKKLNRTSRALLQFMAHYFSEEQLSIDFTENFFIERFRKDCLLLFDGMDEVDPDDRSQVRVAVETLLNEFDSPNLYCLVTARPAAQDITNQMIGFGRCDVQRLEPTQRDELIHLWYSAVIPEDEAKALRQADDLCQRIEDSDERVQELATTPLMVTIFAMVHFSRDTLPQQRARLYEDAVEVLLTEVHHEERDAPGLKQWRGLDWETQRDRLAWIAFELHSRGSESMLEGDLVELIWQRFGEQEAEARQTARRFLQDIADRGGLLEESGGSYGFFTHATFREYLAGRHLAEAYPAESLPAILNPRLEGDQWDEVLRLAAGYLGIRSEAPANRFIRLLAKQGATDAGRAHALALAGEALSDLRVERRLPETIHALTAPMLKIFTTTEPHLDLPLRRRLGLALGAVGDPRLDPLDPDMLPVPAGPFRMGTSSEDEERLKDQQTTTWGDEKPAHIAILSDFEIGKYPVTNLEFRAFWEDEGYEQLNYWSPDGWRWRTGKWESDLSFYSEENQKLIREWLARRPVERRDRPFWWDDPEWSAHNLPVVGVCWFEAEAYCNWLCVVSGKSFRLPTEAEWEKAARGIQAFLWPWGDTWEAHLCNNDEVKGEEHIGRTTPVGMYSHGASPCGALDMVGNVWEWCQDWYDEKEYQQRAESEVTNPRGPEHGLARVVRGGSWDGLRNGARCASRIRIEPVDYYNSLGFRLVCLPQ